MAWAYILRGSSSRHCIGSCTDLDRRLAEHRRGQTRTTKRLGETIELAAALELPTLAEARAFERELKRKKNPKLALYLLQQRASVLGR